MKLLHALRQAALVTFFVGWIILMISLGTLGSLERNATRIPDPATGRVIPVSIKSWTAYFSQAELDRDGLARRGLVTSLIIIVPSFAIGFALQQILRRRNKLDARG